MKRILLPWLFLSLAICSEATSYSYRNTSELIDSSDAIVIGRLEASNPDAAIIVVDETLKGHAPRVIKFKRLPDEPLPLVSERYLFLLREAHGQLEIFHPGCVLNESTEAEVALLLALRRDPFPVLDATKCPPTPNVVHTVGTVFRGFQTRSGPYDWLPFRGDRDVWKVIPWRDKVAVSLKGTVDQSGNATVTITAAHPDSQLAEFLRRYLEATANGPNHVTKPYWVEVDAQIPNRVGKLSQTEALKYLRACLKSDDPKVVVEAIKALATMRDHESLELIRPLVDCHEPLAPVAFYAKQFVAAATRHADGVQYP